MSDTASPPDLRPGIAGDPRGAPDKALPQRGGEMLDPAEAVSGYERSPEDLLRLLVGAAIAIGVILSVKLLGAAVNGFQEDVVGLVAVHKPELARFFEALLSLIGLTLGLLTLLMPLFTRRFRAFGYVLVANVACAALMAAVDAWIDLGGAFSTAATSAGAADALPDATAIAQSAAAIVVFSPFVTRRWRQMLWSLFATMLVLELLVSAHPPATTMVAVAVGPAIGSATLLAFGRPLSRPTLAAILTSLRAAGLQIAEIEPAAVDARGSTPYFATGEDHSRMFVKVLGANERAADLLFRFYRRLRLRNVGDERPDSSLRRTVEHEALVSLQARDVGVATPRMRAVASVGQDSFLLAYDMIKGSSIDKVPTDDLDAEVLIGVWEQVALLHEHRIAHRDLRLANLFLDDQNTGWIIDFGFAEVAADDTLLHADVAQLLASLAVAVGPDLATDTAVEVLGTDTVGACVSRLQLVALSGATQTALKNHPDLLEDLRSKIVQRCNLDAPSLDPLTRFSLSAGAGLLLAAAALYVGIPAVVGFGAVEDALAGGDWAGLIGVIIAVVTAELAMAWQLSSSVPAPLPAGPTVVATVASAFASTTAPSLLGGESLRARFLERHGLDQRSAGAAAALSRAANGVALVVLLLTFVIWAGRSAFDSVDLDQPRALLIGVLILFGIALGVPRGARGERSHAQRDRDPPGSRANRAQATSWRSVPGRSHSERGRTRRDGERVRHVGRDVGIQHRSDAGHRRGHRAGRNVGFDGGAHPRSPRRDRGRTHRRAARDGHARRARSLRGAAVSPRDLLDPGRRRVGRVPVAQPQRTPVRS